MGIKAILSLSITFILIILGIIFNKSKVVFTLQIVWMWLMIGLNSGGGDFGVYTSLFNASSQVDLFKATDSFFITLYYLFKIYDKTLIFTNSVLTIITLFLIFSRTKKMSRRMGLVGSLMLIYPLVENIIQKKTFFASGFVILGFSYLIDDSKHSKIISLIFILIATQIHSSAYAYLVIWILQNLSTNKIKKMIKVLLPLSFIAIPFIPKVASLLFASSKVQLYFYTLRVSLFDSICWIVLHSIFVFMISLLHKQNPKNLSEREYKIEDNVYKLNIISLILLPLYYYEPTFIRIYRNLMIFNYIVFANRQNKTTTKNAFALTTCWLSYVVIVYLTVYVFTGIGFNNLVIPLFENNLFLDWLIGG